MAHTTHTPPQRSDALGTQSVVACEQITFVQIYGSMATCCCGRQENLDPAVSVGVAHSLFYSFRSFGLFVCNVKKKKNATSKWVQNREYKDWKYTFRDLYVWQRAHHINCHSILHLEPQRAHAADLNWGGEQCQGDWTVTTGRKCGGHAAPSDWATQKLISFPALHPSPFTLWENPLLNNSHSVCPPSSHFSTSQTHTVSGWEEEEGGGHQLSAVTILSMDRDGRLSATMVWPICIPVSPPGLWHESQARLPHFHPNIASAKCPFKSLQSGMLGVFPPSQKKKRGNCVEIFFI